MELVQSLIQGDRKALSRLVSLVESDPRKMIQIMREVFPHTGKALLIGITGPPGAGKSSLVDKLIQHFRKEKKEVGVIAIDPSSPFSGGAILGDRIRMQSHATDKGVFIRSLGSRGSHGGLSKATKEIVRLYDAAGFDVIIIETVGVGQTELDIMEIADTTLVVLVPESGDTVQTMKAGLMEIADIFVVNKADRDGAELLASELKEMIHFTAGGKGGWVQPVVLTKANVGEGINNVIREINENAKFRDRNSAELKRKGNIRRAELLEILLDEVRGKIESSSDSGDLKPYFDNVEKGERDPYSASIEVLSTGILAKVLNSET